MKLWKDLTHAERIAMSPKEFETHLEVECHDYKRNSSRIEVIRHFLELV